MTVPAGESLDVTVAAVCLNFGLPTPTPRDKFTLVDVADYSTDSRVRKSLRSLCLLGTSQGVAQAVMWRVCNDLTFEAMASQAGKVINEHEIALAARFIEALDGSTGSDMVDARTLTEGRVFVRSRGKAPWRTMRNDSTSRLRSSLCSVFPCMLSITASYPPYRPQFLSRWS